MVSQFRFLRHVETPMKTMAKNDVVVWFRWRFASHADTKALVLGQFRIQKRRMMKVEVGTQFRFRRQTTTHYILLYGSDFAGDG